MARSASDGPTGPRPISTAAAPSSAAVTIVGSASDALGTGSFVRWRQLQLPLKRWSRGTAGTFGGHRERYRALTLCFAAVCISKRLVQGALSLLM